MSDTGDTVLRPLHGVRDALATLRVESASSEATRAALLRVSDAVETALRRLLRDDPATPMELRLRALATDELSADETISALRQHDRISIEVAALFHDLLAVRRRAEAGGGLVGRDRDLALRLVERLEQEVRSAPQPAAGIGSAAEATLADPGAAYDDADVTPRSLVSRRRGTPARWIAVAVAVLVLSLLGVWWAARSPQPRLDEGVALFRTGDYERAAAHFERYAEARPGDPTPRLYLARIHRRNGRLEEARQELRQALQLAPDDAGLHRELGLLLLDGGQADAAVTRFRTAIDLDPEAAEGWMGLVRALRESGQTAAAERVLERAPAEVRALARRPSPANSP